MSAQSIFYSEYSVRIGMFIGRVLPAPLGHLVAKGFARLADSHITEKQRKAVRDNQWVVHGMKPNKAELDAIVREVYQNSGRVVYDMYHAIQNMGRILREMKLTPEAEQMAERLKEGKKGVMLVGPHMSNFDLAIQCIAGRGVKPLVLSYPEPPPGYRLQNRLRNQHGVTTLPISISALRTAGEKLKEGGVVITGIDRPITSSKYAVNFFGQQAFLPLVHVQLALSAHVPVVTMSCHQQPDGTYLVDTSEEIAMTSFPDHTKEIVFNAEAILEHIQQAIIAYPRQWLMFYPVWPQLSSQVP